MAAHIIRGRMLRPVTLAAVAALALAGCGGSDSADSGGAKPTIVPTGKKLVVKADEYSFSPSTVEAKPRGPLTIELRNEGSQAHDLRVERDGDDQGGTSVFGPGQTKTTIVRLTPGEYEFLCSVGDHAAQGMKGTLTIK
jgi:plastocyanin